MSGRETMRRAIFILSGSLLLVGCDFPPSMKNDDAIAEARTCQAAGMDYEVLRDSIGHLREVQCTKPAPRGAK